MRSILLGIATLFFTIASAHADEVIVIHDHAPYAKKPAPAHYNPKRVPPYSERAILSDAWTRAWLLVDIDAHGRVTRFKFLKRPGYDLETIAAAEIWKQQFAPARDERGNPVAAYAMWKIDWPSHGWLATFNGITTGMPDRRGLGPSPDEYVPCRGSGPLDLSSVYPVYRDCTAAPPLATGKDEPWISRK